MLKLGQLPTKLGYPGKLKQKISLKKEDEVEGINEELISKSKNERKNDFIEVREMRSKGQSSLFKEPPGNDENVHIERERKSKFDSNKINKPINNNEIKKTEKTKKVDDSESLEKFGKIEKAAKMNNNKNSNNFESKKVTPKNNFSVTQSPKKSIVKKKAKNSYSDCSDCDEGGEGSNEENKMKTSMTEKFRRLIS